MTWYAHHVFAAPKEDVIASFQAHASLRRGIYRLENLQVLETARREADGTASPGESAADSRPELRPVGSSPKLPEGGLLVIRELCGPESHAQDWFSPYDISWKGVEVAGPDESIFDVRALVSSVDAGSARLAAAKDLPPPGFLRFLKTTAAATQSVISFFAKNTWGGDTEYAFGWVFDGKRGVHSALVEAQRDGARGLLIHRCGTSSEAPQHEFLVDGDALTWTLGQHGLQLSRGYFELHTRSFPWERYRINRAA